MDNTTPSRSGAETQSYFSVLPSQVFKKCHLVSFVLHYVTYSRVYPQQFAYILKDVSYLTTTLKASSSKIAFPISNWIPAFTLHIHKSHQECLDLLSQGIQLHCYTGRITRHPGSSCKGGRVAERNGSHPRSF